MDVIFNVDFYLVYKNYCKMFNGLKCLLVGHGDTVVIGLNLR